MQLDPTTDESFNVFLPGMPQEDDRALVTEFFVDKKLMGAKSEAAKRPIYEDREYVRITIKGQPHGQPVHEVDEKIRQRFPIGYARFKAGLPAPTVGTPIEQLAGVGPSMAHALKGLKLSTVEDLANVSEEATLTRIGMGARELVQRAKAWVEQKAPEALEAKQEAARLQAELEVERAARIAAEESAKKEREEMQARLEALEKGSPKRKKRRAKKGGAAKRPAKAPQVPAPA